jgi:hypothetical protein
MPQINGAKKVRRRFGGILGPMNTRQTRAMWAFGLAIALLLAAGDSFSFIDVPFDWLRHIAAPLCVVGTLAAHDLRTKKSDSGDLHLLAVGLALAAALSISAALERVADCMPSSMGD